MLLLPALALHAALLRPQQAAADGTPWAKVGKWSLTTFNRTQICVAAFQGALASAKGTVSFELELGKGYVSGKNYFSYAQSPEMELFGAKLAILSGEVVKFTQMSVTDAKQTGLVLELSDQQFEDIAAGDGMLITDAFGTQLAGMRYPAAERVTPMLRRCAREHANIDKGSGKLPATAPVLLAGTLITSDDYPAQATRENAAGRTTVELTVSAKGKVSGCRVVTTSGSESLDEGTCLTLSRRARFTPATDASGNPTESKYQRGVTWTLPG